MIEQNSTSVALLQGHLDNANALIRSTEARIQEDQRTLPGLHERVSELEAAIAKLRQATEQHENGDGT